MSISSLLGSQSHGLSDNFSRTKSMSYNNEPSITILFSEVYIYLISVFIIDLFRNFLLDCNSQKFGFLLETNGLSLRVKIEREG